MAKRKGVAQTAALRALVPGDIPRNPSPDGPSPSGSVLETLRGDFEEFGLNGYEARVLLALLQLGTATASQLASLSGIGRTSVYPVLDALVGKNLAESLPGKLWASPGRDQVLKRLYSAQEERLRTLQARLETAELLLAKLPEGPAGGLPYVHFISGQERVRAAYERLVSSVKEELLMFSRPPFTWSPDSPNPVVLATLERNIRARVLYQRSHIESADNAGFNRQAKAYADAGVEARIVDDLPIKLGIFDRQSVLLTMEDPIRPEIGYPTTQLIEHPGYAAVQVEAFECKWARGTPFGL